MVNIRTILIKVIKAFCVLVGMVFFILTALYFIARMTAMNVKVLNKVSSPDRQWVAVIEEEEYKSMFSVSLYAVMLRPQTRLLNGFREKKIYEVSQESATEPPTVTWQDANNLKVQTDALERDISIQVPEFGNVRISYATK